MEIFGKEYFYQFCRMKIRQFSEESLFRAYLTDLMWGYTHNRIMERRYTDLMDTGRSWKENGKPEQTPDEVIERIRNKLKTGD